MVASGDEDYGLPWMVAVLAEQFMALVGAPLGDGYHRKVVGEDCGHGQGEHRWQGEASALATARVGTLAKAAKRVLGETAT